MHHIFVWIKLSQSLLKVQIFFLDIFLFQIYNKMVNITQMFDRIFLKTVQFVSGHNINGGLWQVLMRSAFSRDLIVIQLDWQETFLLNSYGFNFLLHITNIAELFDNLAALNFLCCFYDLVFLVLRDDD